MDGPTVTFAFSSCPNDTFAFHALVHGLVPGPRLVPVMDDIEAHFGVNREQLRFMPEEKGGDVMGKLVIIDQDPGTGRDIEIDCMRFGSGAYSIPTLVEHLKFKTKAKFILVIETAGAFQRLVKHNFADTFNCILVSMGGVPTRACRRFIRKLSDEMNLPVYAFTDGLEKVDAGVIRQVVQDRRAHGNLKMVV